MTIFRLLLDYLSAYLKRILLFNFISFRYFLWDVKKGHLSLFFLELVKNIAQEGAGSLLFKDAG